VVDVWEDWIVFPPDFTAELRARLDGAAVADAEPKKENVTSGDVEQSSQIFASRFKASSFQPAQAVPVAAASADGAAMEDSEPMDQGSDNVDGEPVEDDMDGEPLNDDVDGDPIDDVDGDPVDEGIDGEPMDDDIDGAPANV